MVGWMPSSGRFLHSARVIAVLTLCSRLLGLLRECVYGYFFSTSELLSAFRIAFMAPNLARRLFGEGALSSALIPVLTENLHRHGEDSSRRLVGSLLTVSVVTLAVVVVAAEAVIAAWRAIAPDVALDLAAILMPYMGLICTVAVAGGVLHVRGHFAAPAAAPIILNTSIILGTTGGAIWVGLDGVHLMYAVCGSVLAGGVAQLILTGVALRFVSFFPIFGGGWRDPQIRRVWILMAPMVLGLSAVQINALADYLIAYLFIVVDGQRVGPAVLGYAQYLYQLPLGVFGISLATAVFPVLSAKASVKDRAGMAEVLAGGVRLSLFIALPASVGLVFAAESLVATILQHGDFDAGDTRRVAGTLVFYSLGLVAYFTQHLLIRAFYALHNSGTPARIAATMVGFNFAMNLSLVFVLQERGLALATAVCATIQVVWLGMKLSSQLPELRWKPIAHAALRTLAATGIMAVVLVVLTSDWVGGSASLRSRLGWAPVVRLITLVTSGVATYALAAWLLRIEELGMVLRRRTVE